MPKNKFTSKTGSASINRVGHTASSKHGSNPDVKGRVPKSRDLTVGKSGRKQLPIRKVKGGWKIDNVPGISKTRAAAERRLKAIKARQSRKGR